MPFQRLIIILAVVFASAALTVVAALALTDHLEVSPTLGLAGLSILALCASFGWRVYSDRKAKNNNGT